MRVEVPVQQTEVWEIDESLCNGLLRFWNLSKDGYYLYGKDHLRMPGVPERVREQVRKKWEELRPLEDDEIQLKDGRKVKLLRANVAWGGVAHTPCDRPCVLYSPEEGRGIVAVGFFDNRLSDDFTPGTAERLQKYWLKNYPWREDECLRWDGKTAHRIQLMGSNEVRLPEGMAHELSLGLNNVAKYPEGLSEQQLARAVEIFKRLLEEKGDAAVEENPNIVDGCEFRLSAFGVSYRTADGPTWRYLHPERSPLVVKAAQEWMKRRKVIIAFGEELKETP